jgi:hypothetical protein
VARHRFVPRCAAAPGWGRRVTRPPVPRESRWSS